MGGAIISGHPSNDPRGGGPPNAEARIFSVRKIFATVWYPVPRVCWPWVLMCNPACESFSMRFLTAMDFLGFPDSESERHAHFYVLASSFAAAIYMFTIPRRVKAGRKRFLLCSPVLLLNIMQPYIFFWTVGRHWTACCILFSATVRKPSVNVEVLVFSPPLRHGINGVKCFFAGGGDTFFFAFHRKFPPESVCQTPAQVWEVPKIHQIGR